jgi:hypothetical protein
MLATNDMDALYNKACIEDKLGRRNDAIFSYKRFIALASTHFAKQIEFAHQRLRKL